MVSQKQLKKVLKKLMNEQENYHCADCGDKRPTWASILVPPPGAPFTESIGCFVCYHCSGAHRRMGTHICFVRSINLDDWKEKEVLAMRRGGNKVANAIFEATLTDKSIKPDKNTELEPRSEFIYQKYQHRTWYDASDASGNHSSSSFGFDSFSNQENMSGEDPFASVGSDQFEANFPDFNPCGINNNNNAATDGFTAKSPEVFGDFTVKTRVSLISNLESKEVHANVMNDISHLDIGPDPLSPQPKPKRLSFGRSKSKTKRRSSNEVAFVAL